MTRRSAEQVVMDLTYVNYSFSIEWRPIASFAELVDGVHPADSPSWPNVTWAWYTVLSFSSPKDHVQH